MNFSLTISPAIQLLRPQQWVKNLFVLVPAFFAGVIVEASVAVQCVVAFAAFSLVASSVYCLNDVLDAPSDRLHPDKCRRPVASGEVSERLAYVLMGVALAAGLAVAVVFGGSHGVALAAVVLAYWVLNVAYCLWLKHVAIVDVCVVAADFVLRLLAGSVATSVVLSRWIVLMTFLLALFLSLAKRRDDVVRMQTTGKAPRRTTARYNLTFINQAITIAATVTIVCYIMFTISPDALHGASNDHLYLTSLFVIIGLLRYIQIAVVDQRSGDPTSVALRDRFLQCVIALWCLAYCAIIYWQ